MKGEQWCQILRLENENTNGITGDVTVRAPHHIELDSNNDNNDITPSSATKENKSIQWLYRVSKSNKVVSIPFYSSNKYYYSKKIYVNKSKLIKL